MLTVPSRARRPRSARARPSLRHRIRQHSIALSATESSRQEPRPWPTLFGPQSPGTKMTLASTRTFERPKLQASHSCYGRAFRRKLLQRSHFRAWTDIVLVIGNEPGRMCRSPNAEFRMVKERHCQVVWGAAVFGRNRGIARSRRPGSESLLGDLIPHLKSGGEFGAVIGDSHPATGRSEVFSLPTEQG